MASAYLDRARASRILADAHLDAVVAAAPEHYYYVTGYRPWVANLYRRAGYGGVVLPTDQSADLGALITDVEADQLHRTVGDALGHVLEFPFWVAYGEVDRTQAECDLLAALGTAHAGQPRTRAGQIDREATTRLLARLLRDMGLASKRIGLEWAFTSADVLGWLSEELPAASFADGAAAFAAMRMGKSPAEVAHLRAATHLTEHGIAAVLADLASGVTARSLVHRYQRAVLAAPEVDRDGLDIGALRFSLRSGPNVLSAEAYGPHRLEPGDVLFLEAGVEVSGYRSDMGRTAVFAAEPTAAQSRVYQALRSGAAAVEPLIRPGTPAAEVFRVGMAAVRASGLPDFVRGNVGHGIGLDPQPEWPILSAESPHQLVPGMVVSVEFPYYLHGLGAFQVEDTYLITDDGAERWTRLPRDLIRADERGTQRV